MNHLVIVGTGLMVHNAAQIALMSGYKVTIVDKGTRILQQSSHFDAPD